jgi:hypothetical protein
VLGLIFIVGLVCAVFGAGAAVGAHNATKVAAALAAAKAVEAKVEQKL